MVDARRPVERPGGRDEHGRQLLHVRAARRLRDGRAAPIHEHTDEVLYVLDGDVDVLLADHVAAAGSGSLTFFPKGSVHGLRARGEARLLTLHTPAGFERIVADLGTRTDERVLPPAGWSPPRVAEDRVAALLDELGLRLLALADPLERLDGA